MGRTWGFFYSLESHGGGNERFSSDFEVFRYAAMLSFANSLEQVQLAYLFPLLWGLELVKRTFA